MKCFNVGIVILAFVLAATSEAPPSEWQYFGRRLISPSRQQSQRLYGPPPAEYRPQASSTTAEPTTAEASTTETPTTEVPTTSETDGKSDQLKNGQGRYYLANGRLQRVGESQPPAVRKSSRQYNRPAPYSRVAYVQEHSQSSSTTSTTATTEPTTTDAATTETSGTEVPKTSEPDSQLEQLKDGQGHFYFVNGRLQRVEKAQPPVFRKSSRQYNRPTSYSRVSYDQEHTQPSTSSTETTAEPTTTDAATTDTSTIEVSEHNSPLEQLKDSEKKPYPVNNRLQRVEQITSPVIHQSYSKVEIVRYIQEHPQSSSTTTAEPTTTEADTTEQPEQLEQFQNGDDGTYYVLLPDGRLQRVKYTTSPIVQQSNLQIKRPTSFSQVEMVRYDLPQQQQQMALNGFIANVQYTDIEPISGPVYAYNPVPLVRILKK